MTSQVESDAWVTSKEGNSTNLPSDGNSYVHSLSENQTDAELGAWWRERLVGAPPILTVLADRPRPAAQSAREETYDFTLGRRTTDTLHRIAHANDTNITSILVAALAALLHGYTHQDDLVVGLSRAGRKGPGPERPPRAVYDTLPLRLDLSSRPRFVDVLRQATAKAIEAVKHGMISFEGIVKALHLDWKSSHHPIVQVALSTEPPDTFEYQHGLHASGQQAALDLTLRCWEVPDGMTGRCEYTPDLFDPATIQRFVEHFVALLATATAEPEREIGALHFLTAADERLLSAWNHTEGPAPVANSYHELFAACAARAPERIAVMDSSGRSVTYGELEVRANRLAHHLRKRGVGSEDLVAVCMDRSIELVVAILAVFKAGGAYLPLDPMYPEARLAFMVSDATPKMLVTQSHLERLLPGIANVVRIDTDAEQIASEPDTAPENRTEPGHLAYVIYTSGSTGQPKGMMTEHRNLVHLTEAQRLALGMTADARVLQFSPLSFDAGIWELSTTLTVGATLCMLPPGRPPLGAELGRLIQRMRISFITLIPSILPDVPVELLSSVETLIVAGEACSAELVSRFSSGRRFVNAYGPTECTVCATLAVCEPGGPPPIGRPLANTRVYVLDEQRNPVPIGMVGELYIGGDGVGRGYLHRPELTAERFLADPFVPQEAGARMYRTGDLVRWRSDGNLEFLGRSDAQVKVRGFRIELGEIESAIREHDAVADVAVVAPPDQAGNRRLVAYVVFESGAGNATTSVLRSALMATLPNYLVPEIIAIEALPLAPSGKVNRIALAAMPLPRTSNQVTYVAPRSALESSLADAWAEVLKIERVGIHDDFFAIGGHSLLVPSLMLRINDRLGIDVPMHMLFEAPTIAELAELIGERSKDPRHEALCFSPDLVVEQEAALAPEIHGRELPEDDGAEPANVLLTGATGFVGPHLLSELLATTSATIYCLVRAKSRDDAMRRLRDGLATYNLPTSALEGRVEPLLGDLGSERLGLDRATFDHLATTIDVIFHNGAKVDHNRGYATMKAANVFGTHEILRLASRGRRKPVQLVSSLATIPPARYRESGVVAEGVPGGPLAELPNGYMQSKCVAEYLVREAMARGIPATIYRLGAVSGHSITGACNENDYTYSALRSLIQLGFSDDLDIDLRIVPVDFVTKAIVALSRWSGATGETLHITNPQPLFWIELIDLVKKWGYRVQEVSYGECMRGLIRCAREGLETPMLAFLPFHTQRRAGMSRYLLEDYYAPVRWDCKRTIAGLTEMKVPLPPEPRRLARLYVDYLVQQGHIRPPE